MKKLTKIFTMGLLALSASVGAVNAQSLTLSATNAASGVSWDNTYQSAWYEWLEVYNNGVNAKTTQIAFDTTSLTNLGAVSITNATLTLTAGAAGGANSLINIYQLVPANSGFNSGGTWGTKTNGGASWAGGANGASVAGTDYVNTLLGQASISSSGLTTGNTLDFNFNAAGLAVIQSIVNGTDTNPGFVLIEDPSASSAAGSFFTTSAGIYGQAGPQPTLTLTYTGNTTLLITTNPANASVHVGNTATFNVGATVQFGDSANITYQWQKNSANISGATTASYTTPPITAADAADTFDCVVSYPGLPSQTSTTASLIIQGFNGLTLAATQVASGVQYAIDYPNVAGDGALEVNTNTNTGNPANGNATTSQVGFDTASLSSLLGSTVTGATLTLTGWRDGFGENSLINLYELVPANAGFNANGTYATKNGSASWAGGANGASVAGVDYVNTLLGSVSIGSLGETQGQTLHFTLNAAGLAVIQNIVNGTDPNPGFVLIGDPSATLNTRAAFFDGIHGVGAGPSLTVTCTPDPLRTPAYQAWASSGFAGFTETAPTQDPDGDGMTNQQEYAFGLDPTKGSSSNPIVVPLNKSAGTFSYTRQDPLTASTGATGLTYRIYTSTNLSTWTLDAGATQNVTDQYYDVQTVEVTLSGLPLTAPKLFVRVAAQ